MLHHLLWTNALGALDAILRRLGESGEALGADLGVAPSSLIHHTAAVLALGRVGPQRPPTIGAVQDPRLVGSRVGLGHGHGVPAEATQMLARRIAIHLVLTGALVTAKNHSTILQQDSDAAPSFWPIVQAKGMLGSE